MNRCWLAKTVIVVSVFAANANASEVESLIRQRCGQCHLAEHGEGGLQLDRLEPIHDGFRDSLLNRLRTSDMDLRMPPEGKPLSESEITSIATWVDHGAPWSDGDRTNRAFEDHWAMQPLPRWQPRSIDRIADRVTRELGKQRPEVASREVLIRRLSFDLRGLPPTPHEIQSFIGDDRPTAYRSLVDRWLASPDFGDHWANQWLDLARYADTDGSYEDGPREGTTQYRDWVIDSFQRDQPFDQFTIEQLSGDLLPRSHWEHAIAVSFHRNTPVNRDACADPVEERFNRLVDRVNTTSTVWLGLTLQCAQCHDHKIDPVTSRQYYELMAFFADAEEAVAYRDRERYAKMSEQLAMIQKNLDSRLRHLRRNAESDVASSNAVAALVPGKASQTNSSWFVLGLAVVCLIGSISSAGKLRLFASLSGSVFFLLGWWMIQCPDVDDASTPIRPINVEQRFKQLNASDPVRRKLASEIRIVKRDIESLAQVDSMKYVPTVTHIHPRGRFDSFGEKVRPSLPGWFGSQPKADSSALTRLDLSEWIVHQAKPLTARVMANRVFGRLMGHYVIAPDDFGAASNPGRYEELIGQLAAALTEDDWSRKSLIRRIVTSRAYQSATPNDSSEFSLLRRRRLTAEEIRDTYLRIGGKLVSVTRTSDDPTSKEREVLARARTIYQTRTRQGLPALLLVFDSPDRQKCCVQRNESRGVLQTLATLNDPLAVDTAESLGSELYWRTESDEQKIFELFQRCLSRSPDAAESGMLVEWLNQTRGVPDRVSERGLWCALARVVLAHEEMLFRP